MRFWSKNLGWTMSVLDTARNLTHPQPSTVDLEVELGIGDLEHLNASNASRSYELSDESKQIIQDAFPNDFEELGYDR